MKGRLDRLGLAGCNYVNQTGLAILDAFVRHDRDVNLPFSKGHFDLWPCVHCPLVIDEGLQCVDCKSVACRHHGEMGTGPGEIICSFCDAYVCLSADCGAVDQGDVFVAHGGHCVGCEVEVCYKCAFDTEEVLICSGRFDIPGCYRVMCINCDESKGYPNEYITITNYPTCGASWCASCESKYGCPHCHGGNESESD
jgi:hypothetical protein